MESKIKAQLEQAKACYYAGRLNECYAILKRFFDRLPFEPRPEHAEFIAMFCGVLIDLGRDFDLVFYVRELERLQEVDSSEAIMYALAVVYYFSPEPRGERITSMFDTVARKSVNPSIRERAKMMLAVHLLDRDFSRCRQVVESFIDIGDEYLARSQKIWRGVILRRQQKNKEAREILESILRSTDESTDCYSYVSALIILGMIEADETNFIAAGHIVERVTLLVNQFGSPTSLDVQCRAFVTHFEKAQQSSRIRIAESSGIVSLQHNDRCLVVSNHTAAERLLILFTKKLQLTKYEIVSMLYGRDYQPSDDKTIHYHVHFVRRKMKALGISNNPILLKEGAYCLVPLVEFVSEMK